MIAQTIGDRCREARHKRGLSQEELAARAGVSGGVIANTEWGRNKTIRKLTAVARALEVDPHWLATGNGPAAPLRLAAAPGTALPDEQDQQLALHWLATWHAADDTHRALIESAFAVAASSAAPRRRQA